MKEIAKGIAIIASSKYRLNIEETSMIKGGSREQFKHDLDMPVAGCGCCMCSPSQSASGAKSYTATSSGARML